MDALQTQLCVGQAFGINAEAEASHRRSVTIHPSPSPLIGRSPKLLHQNWQRQAHLDRLILVRLPSPPLTHLDRLILVGQPKVGQRSTLAFLHPLDR